MDSRQLKKKLRNIKSFIGVYPRDALPNVGKRPVALIANTDSRYEPGEHWIAIILLKDGVGEYFDSYGLPPLHGEDVSKQMMVQHFRHPAPRLNELWTLLY